MELKQLHVDKIRPNPFQPRERFDKDSLQELSQSIQSHELIEPIVVTKRGKKYMIVAGERRWRAHRLAKKRTIPAIIKPYESDAAIKRDSLIENVVRDNLSNTEFKAYCYSLAKSLGKGYFDNGEINVANLSRYVVGSLNTAAPANAFHKRLNKLLQIDRYATPAVKHLLRTKKIDADTAAVIAGTQNKQTQNEIVSLVKQDDYRRADIKHLVQTHNAKKDAELSLKKAEAKVRERDKLRSEMDFVTKFTAKIGQWNLAINTVTYYIMNNRQVLKRFSKDSKLEMLDRMKKYRRDLERAQHVVTKLMGELSK